ncbi:MAG: twin-arginine translocase TatA/TatE family subunit [Chloroflexi bacterium]|nr:twin-arginine translocase TatA/TatE family subunit [Chloroflexota bacterium]
MGALSPIHLVIILVVALLILGPGKLPETGAALGKSIREFRDAIGGRGSDTGTAGPGDPPAAS